MSGPSPEFLRGCHRDLDLEVASVSEAGGETLRVTVPGAQARTLLARLHASEGSSALRLIDLTVVDRRDEARPGVEIVYRLEAEDPGGSLRVHARVVVGTEDDAQEPRIDSVAGLWPAAGWLEREARELFGVRFGGAASSAPLLLDPGAVESPPLRRVAGVRAVGSSTVFRPGSGSG
jgi:NADH:ubiquinone oxidoreductase subunit C